MYFVPISTGLASASLTVIWVLVIRCSFQKVRFVDLVDVARAPTLVDHRLYRAGEFGVLQRFPLAPVTGEVRRLAALYLLVVGARARHIEKQGRRRFVLARSPQLLDFGICRASFAGFVLGAVSNVANGVGFTAPCILPPHA